MGDVMENTDAEGNTVPLGKIMQRSHYKTPSHPAVNFTSDPASMYIMCPAG